MTFCKKIIEFVYPLQVAILIGASDPLLEHVDNEFTNLIP